MTAAPHAGGVFLSAYNPEGSARYPMVNRDCWIKPMSNWFTSVESFLAHPVVSLLIGTVITWFFSKLYYMRSGRELTAAAERLARLSELLLRLVESHGLGQKTTVNRDAEGHSTGLVQHAEVRDSIQASVQIVGATLTTVKRDDSVA
jgi:hypothetical protein